MNNPDYDKILMLEMCGIHKIIYECFAYLDTYKLFIYTADAKFVLWEHEETYLILSCSGPFQLASVWISILEGVEKQYGFLQGGCHLTPGVSRDDSDINKWWGYF